MILNIAKPKPKNLTVRFSYLLYHFESLILCIIGKKLTSTATVALKLGWKLLN